MTLFDIIITLVVISSIALIVGVIKEHDTLVLSSFIVILVLSVILVTVAIVLH